MKKIRAERTDEIYLCYQFVSKTTCPEGAEFEYRWMQSNETEDEGRKRNPGRVEH